MLTTISYFSFLLAALTITLVIFIGLRKIQLILNELNKNFIKIFRISSSYINSIRIFF